MIEVVHYCEEPLKTNFSDFLSKRLNHDYTYLSNLFSEVQGTTIEHFLIAHKIEKVKELSKNGRRHFTKQVYPGRRSGKRSNGDCSFQGGNRPVPGAITRQSQL